MIILFANTVSSQIVARTINVTIPGSLTVLLTSSEKPIITNLTVTGSIDARDIKCFRDEMTKLSVLDISLVNIQAYNGNGGTDYEGSSYSANEIPNYSFMIFRSSTSSYTGKESLTSVKLPITITSIGKSAFQTCIELSGKLEIPNSVTTIKYGAFSGCTGLTGNLELGNSIVQIESYAFYNCSGLNILNIGNSLTSIGSSTFSNCNGLIEINVNAENLNYSSIDGVLFNKNQTNLIIYPSGKNGNYIIPNTVTTINDNAFNGSKELLNILIPSSLTTIGMRAFEACMKLKNIEIPSSVNTIGMYAFNRCSQLTIISVSPDNSNYSSKDGVLFNRNQSVLLIYPAGKQGSYLIPSTVSTVEKGSFQWCNGLTGITFPNSVTTIGEMAFVFCTNMTSLILGNSITTIGGWAFQNCEGLGKLEIPNSVTTIGTNAFSSCKGLSAISIGYSVSNIADGAFNSYPNNIKIINCLNPTPPSMSTNTFNCSPIVYVPPTSVNSYKAANGWSSFTILGERRVVIDNPIAGGLAGAIVSAGYSPLNTITHLTVTGNLNNVDILKMNTMMTSLTEIDMSNTTFTNNYLPDNAFQNRINYTSVKLPSNLQSIGISAFSNCTSLCDVTLPSTLNLIGSSAFSNCSSLSKLNLPSSVNSIGKSAFKNCSLLSCDLIIANGITILEDSTFYNCTNLKGNIIIPNTTTTIGRDVFYNCWKLYGNLLIPNSVNSIGSNAFYNCSNLTGNLNIPSSITKIESGTFNLCQGFTGELKLPNSVTTIDSWAFAEMSGINSVIIPNFVSSIGYRAFYSSGATGDVTIPKSVVNIGEQAFLGCQSLNNFIVDSENPNYSAVAGVLFNKEKTTLIQYPGNKVGSYSIPNSATSYSYYAFNYCKKLTSIKIPNTISRIESFWGCSELSEATIPNTVTSYGIYIFKYCDKLKKISLNNSNPVSIDSYTFDGVNKETCILEIPIGSGLSYMTADYWSDFIFINEIDFGLSTKIANNSENHINIHSTHSEIVLEGIQNDEIVTIYNIFGMQLKSIKSKGEMISIPLKSGSVYIVKTSIKTVKVLLY